MNPKSLSNHYSFLTAAERFQLVVAAGARGDAIEQDRLVRAGQKLNLTLSDHAPYAQALGEVSYLAFLELLEEAARYWDAFARVDCFCDSLSDKEEPDDDSEVEVLEHEAADTKKSPWQRAFDLALASGYVLKAKTEGWRLFCERRSVPPDALWKDLPGFERLQRALDLAQKAAFAPEGFLCWMNDVRPAGEPELSHVSITAGDFAEQLEAAFNRQVQWWNG